MIKCIYAPYVTYKGFSSATIRKILMSPALVYFIDYWEDLYSGISSKRDLLKIFNPRVVIQEILDEITLNKQTNKANEEFFRRTLSNYLKNDPASLKRLRIHLQMILKEFDLVKKRPRYLPKLCMSTLDIFQNLEYFEDCIECLINLNSIASLTESDKQHIKVIVNNLIVEFREIGYTDKEIRDFPKDVFSQIQQVPDMKHTIWRFPHPIVCNDWSNEADLAEYKVALENYQSTLTDIDRIKALVIFAKKDRQSIRYIFRVNGAESKEEFEVGDVLFYSPNQKKLITNHLKIDPDNKLELFNGPENVSFLNVSTIVNAINPESGESTARSKIERALSLFRRVMHGSTSLWISQSYLSTDINGKILSTSSHTFEKLDDDFTKKFIIDDQNQSKYRNKILEIEKVKSIAENNGWGRRFNESCYWLRRAEESTSNVDKLLAYWICIEILCAKSEDDANNWLTITDGHNETDIFLIKEVVGKLRAVGKFYEYGWLLHKKLCDSISNPFLQQITIPADLINKAQLNASHQQEIYLIKFVNTLDEISNVLPESLLREQAVELNNFFKDNKVALSVLKNNLQTAKDELAFIYRMRNKIAHDGSSEHPLLSSLCKIAAEYAYSFFYQINHRVSKGFKEQDLRSILISGVQDYDLIEMRLHSESPLEVFLSE